MANVLIRERRGEATDIEERARIRVLHSEATESLGPWRLEEARTFFPGAFGKSATCLCLYPGPLAYRILRK